MDSKIDVDEAPVHAVVMPCEVYCPACGIISKTEGPSNEFAAFVGCRQCHRLVKVIFADGDVSDVLKA